MLGLAPGDSPAVDPPTVLEPRLTAAPEFAVAGRRRVTAQGFRVELDLTSQVLAIRALPDPEFDFELDGLAGTRGPREARLSATLGTIDSTEPVSASVLAQKAKIFDDGIYAAVEVAAQRGAGRHTGKAGLLASLGSALAKADPTAAGAVQDLLLGAARLGQVRVPGIPTVVAARVQRATEAFLADTPRSTPMGFYTWSTELTSIFQQDRMLQGELNGLADIDLLVDALRADPSARAAYEHHLRLVSRLTNPFAAADLRGLLAAQDRHTREGSSDVLRFFPPSVAHETRLIKRLYGDRPIPEGFVLIDEMIRRIRSGDLHLEPSPQSGWHDHQTWALEPLVIPERMPEGTRLELDDEYRTLLLELFKGLLTQTRETHIKQLEMPVAGSAAYREREVYIDIAPALTAEPLVTYYLRRALSYRYVRAVLEDSFGPGQLERLHRLTPGGSASASLAAELVDLETIFIGAHVSACRQIGLAPDPASGAGPSASAAADRFAAWARELHRDPDLSLDLRTMVPVFYDLARGKTKVWLFLGWSRRAITVSFARPPQATIMDLDGQPARDHPGIRWQTQYARLAYPITAELYVDHIMDRDEFRSLCDVCGTRSEILRRLGVPTDPAP